MTAQAGGTASLLQAKARLRRELRAGRGSLPKALRRAAAERAARHLARACRAWNARHVAVYLSQRDELATAPLIRRLERSGCRVYVPKIAAAAESREMRFVRLRGPLMRNRYGIREPAARAIAPRLDVVVLPVVAFDADGRRLGMGGGYYDRRLARAHPWRRPLRVGFAYAAQQVPRVPAGAHDATLHAIATERGVRRF